MSRLTDLIAKAKAKDASLGAELEREFKVLSTRLPFGLNFERHSPEVVELPLRPIRKGKKLELNARIPRIARRFEAAFDSLSIGFHKTRPTRLFLQKMASDPSSVLPVGSADQFERLFKAINAALEKHLAR